MAGEFEAKLGGRGNIGQPAGDAPIAHQFARAGAHAFAIEGARTLAALAQRIFHDADSGIEQFIGFMAQQEAGLARDCRRRHRAEQMADKPAGDARFEKDRQFAAGDGFGIQAFHRAPSGFAAHRFGGGQIGKETRAARGVIGLHRTALARHHAGRKREAAAGITTGKTGRCRQRDHGAAGAGTAAIAVGHAFHSARRFLGRERGFAQGRRIGLVGIVQFEIGQVAGELRIGRGKARVPVFGGVARHLHGAFGQRLQPFGREIAGMDRGGAFADKDAQADLLAFGAFDLFQLAESHRHGFRSIGAGHGVGRIRSGLLCQCDEFLTARQCGFFIDHASPSTPQTL